MGRGLATCSTQEGLITCSSGDTMPCVKSLRSSGDTLPCRMTGVTLHEIPPSQFHTGEVHNLFNTQEEITTCSTKEGSQPVPHRRGSQPVPLPLDPSATLKLTPGCTSYSEIDRRGSKPVPHPLEPRFACRTRGIENRLLSIAPSAPCRTRTTRGWTRQSAFIYGTTGS